MDPAIWKSDSKTIPVQQHHYGECEEALRFRCGLLGMITTNVRGETSNWTCQTHTNVPTFWGDDSWKMCPLSTEPEHVGSQTFPTCGKASHLDRQQYIFFSSLKAFAMWWGDWRVNCEIRQWKVYETNTPIPGGGVSGWITPILDLATQSHSEKGGRFPNADGGTRRLD